MAADQVQLLCTFSREQVVRALRSIDGDDPGPLHLRPGDRVRVTFEGTVSDRGAVQMDDGSRWGVPAAATIERIG